MKVRIRYRTRYDYEEPVSFSPHLFRLFPRGDAYVRMTKHTFKTNKGAWVKYRRDLFDNEIVYASYPEKGATLDSVLEMELAIKEKNAFDFLVDSSALEIPFEYSPQEKAVLAPYFGSAPKGRPFKLPFWERPRKSVPTVPTLVELNHAIYSNIRYERRDEGDPLPPAETLKAGAGSCRDFMLVLAEALRSLGIAARLVSGYLCEFDAKQKKADGSFHAWTEAYLPGAGWIGFDPTNGSLCNHNQIPTAVGLTPADITPVLGSYYGKKKVPATMDARLEMKLL